MYFFCKSILYFSFLDIYKCPFLNIHSLNVCKNVYISYAVVSKDTNKIILKSATQHFKYLRKVFRNFYVVII